MAPRLLLLKIYLIRDMIESRSLTITQKSKEAECSKVTIINTRRILRLSGRCHAPPTRIGRRRTITPLIIEALRNHLSEKPSLYLDEMAVFCRMSSILCSQPLASEEPLLLKVVRR